jgi:UDP-N-acetylmuramoyl-tripeptide--D-alanyl-D-alanine ligase
MVKLNAADIAAAVQGNIISGPKDAIIDRVSLDTRTLEPGSLFIPLRGERFDGHDFLHQAAEKGARAALVDREGEYHFPGVTVIRVKDTLEAFHSLALWYRNKFDADFVAVTGSTGKTTTKNIIAEVLRSKYNVLKSEGNFNNQVGLPATIMRLDESHRAAVVEMGMSGYGEIRALMKIVRPKVSVVTNIGMSHIERLGSREGILRAKMEIFEGMDQNPTAVVNADDPLLCQGVKSLKAATVYYGVDAGDYRASDIRSRGEKGTSYTLLAEGKSFEVTLPLPGRHNVYNSLAAVAVGRVFNIGFPDIIKALRGLKGEKMRLSIQTSPGGVKVINDAYNASPDSMKSALEVLRDAKGDRKIAVLSDMLEMGDFAEEGHALVGTYAAESGVDILITVGDYSRYIACRAKERGMDLSSVYHFESKREAAQLLDGLLKKGDVVLVKGSRGMRMEELASRILERS